MNEMRDGTAQPHAATGRPADHPPVQHGRIGVLLLNLGTPDGTDYWSMRRYLKEFLSDRRVIEVPRLIWWPLLNARDPDHAARPQGPRLRRDLEQGARRGAAQDHHPRRRRSSWQRALGGDGRVVVDWAMRYANPSTESRIRALQEQGCDRILLVPLYPHYAAATTATACDQAFRALMKMRWQPAVRVAPAWHDDPVYIDALARPRSAGTSATLDFEPEVLIATFHGMPKKYLLAGRPLSLPVREDRPAAARGAGLADASAASSRSSRASATTSGCSPTPTRPSRRWPSKGVKSLAMVAPGFTADCLETLEELDVENREIFMQQRRREVRLHPLPQRQRRGHARDRDRGAPRADGLGVSGEKVTRRSRAMLLAALLSFLIIVGFYRLAHRLADLLRCQLQLVGRDRPLVSERVLQHAVAVAPEHVGDRHRDLGAGLDRARGEARRRPSRTDGWSPACP